MNILVTGSAGFIGYHLCKRLLNKNNKIFGIDNLNSYYSTKLKKDREESLKKLAKKKNFFYRFYKIDLKDKKKLNNFFFRNKIDIIFHIAAQAGVKYSLSNPEKYIDSNIISTTNLLENCRKNNIRKFIFASSSSVYGNSKVPFDEKDLTNKPLAFYAASKVAAESISYAYSNLYNIKCICLRFFTVYGPWGRPDMALYSFVEKILNNQDIELYNNGNYKRDFTYIDDIISGVVQISRKFNKIKNYEVFNIGRGKPEKIINYLNIIQKYLNTNCKIKKKNKNIYEANITFASIKKIKKFAKFTPKTDIEIGIKKFIDWYIGYKKINVR